MRRCAFLSTDDLHGYVTDDLLALEPLRARGWDAREVSWRATGQDWSEFEAVIVRSTWDYHRHLEAFLETLARIDAHCALYNPRSLIRWNARKTYLRDLELRGVPTVPTAWTDGPLGLDWLDGQFDALDDAELVVKPQVGANAEHTYRLVKDADPALRERARVAFQDRACMVQPFLRSIQDQGESSLFYLGGEYSHAVKKCPRPGDFRVQEEHGGRIEPLEAGAPLRAAAADVLHHLDAEPLYARVDLVEHHGGLRLIELELIEPSMYLRMDPGAPARFADAIDRWCRGG